MCPEFEDLEVFKALDEEDLTFIRRRVRLLTMRKGQVLYTYADLAHNIYFVAEGRVKLVSISDEGDEFIKAIVGPCRMFGGQGLMGAVSYGEIAEVQLEGSLFVLPARDVRDLMVSNTGFGMALLRNVSERLRNAEQRLVDASFKDARTRIKDFLFDFVREYGRKRGPDAWVCSFLSHQDIARLTGASRQTVTSVLNQLKREGLVDYNRRSLVVKQLQLRPGYQLAS